MKRANRLSYLVVCVILLVGGCAVLIATGGCSRSDAATGETVFRYQQAYFQNITSLTLAATVTVTMSEEWCAQTGISQRETKVRGRFTHCGDRAFTQLDYFDAAAGGDQSLTCTYDGEQYYLLTSGDKPVLSVTSGSLGKENMRANGALHPLSVAFAFASSDMPEFSLKALQNEGRWTLLAQRIEHVERRSLLGHNGVQLTMRNPAADGVGSDVWEVFFAADLGYFPVWSRCAWADGRTTECEVAKVEHRDCLTHQAPFPVALKVTELLASGDLMQNAQWAVVGDSLKVNENMDDTVFAIPVSLACTYVNENTGMQFKPIGRDPEFARRLINAVYQGSMATVASSLAEEMKEDVDTVSPAVGTAMKQRYGEIQTVDLIANDRVGGMLVDTVWSVSGDTGSFEMKLSFNQDDRVTQARFRRGSGQEWGSMIR